ncbi:MAG: heparinase II/III-family protein [Bacteroidales bacterium]|nr:heparinase II/III-family protein [Bacteroidales bacterium]
MRNRIAIILSSLCLTLLCSCKGNLHTDPNPVQIDTTIVDAYVEIAIRSTKVEMNGISSFAWTRKDKVSIFSSEEQTPSAFVATDRGRSVGFDGKKHETDVLLYALSPYDADAAIEGNTIRTTISESQNGNLGSMLLFGSAVEKDYFEVYPNAAVLKFSVPEKSGTRELSITSQRSLCGPVKIDVKTGALTSTSSKSKTIRVSGIDPDNSGTYYVSCVPDPQAESISVTFDGGTNPYIVRLTNGIQPGINDIGKLSVIFTIHPLLFLKGGEEALIEKRIEENQDLRNLHTKIINRADGYISDIPSVYNISTGGVREQLLYVSRAALNYLLSFSYAYRMTLDKKYLEAAQTELKAVCTFPDWHPAHYLDMGEMATGVAIAYDWLYSALDEDIRALCEQALEHYALDTFYDKKNVTRWWYQVNNNRNQVCSTGLYLAAMVLRNLIPEKCNEVMPLMAASVKVAVDGYDPDGNYMEGTGYWSYGTSWQALLNYAMETNGIVPYYGGNGFLQTPHFLLHMKGPSGDYFNYNDGGSECDLEVAQFYFAQWQKNTNLLWWELKAIKDDFKQTNRLLPLALCFAKNMTLTTINPPTELTWYGKGTTPVYSTRLSWSNPQAAWFAIKGGFANTSHAHMDGGSFVYEVGGVRWVIDLGGESYTALVNAGIDQGSLAQDSPRWDVLAYCNSSHSGLRLDDERYLVAGKASILSVHDDSERRGVLMNLSPLFAKATSVSRKASLMKSTGVLEVVDKVKPTQSVKYTFTAPNDKNTTAIIKDSNTIQLVKDDKRLEVHIECSDPSLKITPVSRVIKPDNTYESANARAIDFNCQIPGGVETTFTTTFTLLQ